MFRVTETFQKEGSEAKAKFNLSIDPLHPFKFKGDDGEDEATDHTFALHLREAIMVAFAALGGERKLGCPPRGALERLLQKKLRTLQRKNADK